VCAEDYIKTNHELFRRLPFHHLANIAVHISLKLGVMIGYY